MHHLFAALSPEYRQRLESLPTALDTVAPLRTAHRRDLPMAIHDLSLVLTSERGSLSDPYWAAPRLLSAYLRYFMPWNLVRLGRLLPSLDLVDRDALLERPLILDLGSGPLTLPLALWLARPDLRSLPLTFLCADIAPHPLEVGRELLQVIAGEESPRALRTLRAPMEAALKEARGDAALILAGNVLNELKPRRDEPLEFRMEDLAEKIGSALSHGGRVLVIEPGTRLGARYVTLFRRAAMEVGLAPLAPCPHHDECPLLEQGGAGGWCHFTFPIQGAPTWLEELSRRAKLEKGTASLSFVLLGEADKVTAPRNTIRIISDAFPLPGRREPARYACSERGLALLHDARHVHSGTAIDITWPEVEHRDRKSGALELEWTPPSRDSKTAGTAGAAGKGPRGKASPVDRGEKPVRGKAAGRAAQIPDDEDDTQPAFLMEGAARWDTPVAAGAGTEGDDFDADHELEGHDPSEPDGNRADGPDHGATYSQMFANQPHGGRAAQRRGVPRFGARRGRTLDGGYGDGFAGDAGAGYGARRHGVQSDDFGNRAESGGRRSNRTGRTDRTERDGGTGMRKTGRGAGQPDGQRADRRERHPDGQRADRRERHPDGQQGNQRGQWANRRPRHGEKGEQTNAAQDRNAPNATAQRALNAWDDAGGEAPSARRGQHQGRGQRPAHGDRDGQQRAQGRPQRPFGNARRQRPDGPQEGRREGRGDHDRQQRAPRQDGNQERGRERRPDQTDRMERGDRHERSGERHEHRPQRHPGARSEAPRDRRPDHRQDRPADARPDARPDAPRDFGGQQRPDESRKGKPRRHFDREGRPGGQQDRDGRAPRRAEERRPEERRPDERRPTDRRPEGRGPATRRDDGQQRSPQGRPGSQPERAGRGERGERGGDQRNAPRNDRRPGGQPEQRTDRRPERPEQRRDDRRDDRRAPRDDDRRNDRRDDRPDNGQHQTRRRRPRRDD
ncbi:small ribosomal subunit Rsm22 family protein [Nitratidesulfovibrio liaohensis]|uniref:Small ribosomal subunit Rsm22 n=1 Tax=Nitratidesulfovibrio liaohensis TaxID=2604158 RepID=A0ABY9R5Y4_9BACT|nr:small ribosomal subunit Rsm22 family protein [Nitratidesulfovibrio liaohensis]WMW67037.1 hypothetical protein KPS_001680 [Nitratidesulfovibrio liaohensis]